MTHRRNDRGARGRGLAIAIAALMTVLLAAVRPAAAQSVSVTLDLTGSGAGTVTSSPAGLSCSGTAQTCTGQLLPVMFVTLTATPTAGHTFAGWSGVCTGTGPCTFWPTAGVLLAATFQGPASVTTPYVFYHPDALGSVRAITNEQGTVVTRHDYQPFGEDGQPLTGDPIRFGGKELDAETALSYFGARYYRTTQGRFTTVDPVMDVDRAVLDPQAWNRYAYARNNPLKYVDRDGRIFETVWDVLNVGMGVASLAHNLWTANWGKAAEDVGGLAVDAAATMIPVVPGGAATALKVSRAAELAASARRVDDVIDAVAVTRSSLRLGQDVHKAYKAGLANGTTLVKEFRLPSGKKIDFLDLEKGLVYELKPNNRRAIQEGQKQLQGYLDELRELFPDVEWHLVLEVY